MKPPKDFARRLKYWMRRWGINCRGARLEAIAEAYWSQVCAGIREARRYGAPGVPSDEDLASGRILVVDKDLALSAARLVDQQDGGACSQREADSVIGQFRASDEFEADVAAVDAMLVQDDRRNAAKFLRRYSHRNLANRLSAISGKRINKDHLEASRLYKQMRQALRMDGGDA